MQVYKRTEKQNLKRTSLDCAKAPKNNAEEEKQERMSKRNGIHCRYVLRIDAIAIMQVTADELKQLVRQLNRFVHCHQGNAYAAIYLNF
jgi:hypothetical protein